MLQRRLEVDDFGRRAEVGARGRVQRLLPLERVDAVLALVVADERDPVRLAVVQHDRRPVAAERVGVLPQLARLQIERPDVVDVAVARDVGLERHRRIGRRRREHDRVIVDELRGGLVLRAEGELRLLLGVDVEPPQLVVAADAHVIDDVRAVGRVHRRRVGELVVGQIDDRLRLQIDRVDIADAAAQRVEHNRPAVGREVRRLGLVDRRHRGPQLDIAREHVLDDERPLLLGAHEVREPIAPRRPRHPRHLEPLAHEDDVIEAHVLVEAAREVADDRAVLGRQQDHVELAVFSIHGRDRHQIARGRRRDREGVGVIGLLAVRREIAAVVGRPLLVAERLEPILQIALEGLIELVLLHAERFFVRVLAAADDALAQREQELADAFLPVLRLDELEDRVTEVVDESRVVRVAVAFELGHLRHDVGDRRVAHRHEIDRIPLRALVVRQPFVHPQRHAAADERLRDDVELEDVRQLVRNEAVQLVGRLVDRQQHAVSRRLGERRDAFRRGVGARDVLLLELAVRLEQHQRHFEGEIVFEIGADLLIRALGVAGDALQVLLDLGVVINLEVIGGVDHPLELVVVDVVLAEIGDQRRLRARRRRAAGHDDRGEERGGSEGRGQQRHARAHKQIPRKVSGDLTVDADVRANRMLGDSGFFHVFCPLPGARADLFGRQRV